MADHLKSKRHSKTKPNRPFKIRTSSEFEPLLYLGNYLKTGLTKGSVDENLKWISMPKIVPKKAQNSSDLFLPFHLHFCTVTEIIKQ